MRSHQLDPFPILRALGIGNADSALPVTGGAGTAIWRVERGGTTFALRVFRPDEGRVCAREVAAMEAARGGGIPVPAVHAEGAWEGRPALLLSWCPGRPLLDHLLRYPWRAVSLGRVFGRMQAAIHAVPAPSDLPVDRESLIENVPEREGILRAVLQGPDIRRDTLVHLDYHPLNVMVEGDQISGVLDWSDARAGDPRLDLARSRTILRLDMGRPARPALVNAALEPLWRAVDQGWWQGYTEVAPVETDLAIFYALAGAIMEKDLSLRYTARRLQHVRDWTERWKKRAGIDV